MGWLDSGNAYARPPVALSGAWQRRSSLTRTADRQQYMLCTCYVYATAAAGTLQGHVKCLGVHGPQTTESAYHGMHRLPASILVIFLDIIPTVDVAAVLCYAMLCGAVQCAHQLQPAGKPEGQRPLDRLQNRLVRLQAPAARFQQAPCQDTMVVTRVLQTGFDRLLLSGESCPCLHS